MTSNILITTDNPIDYVKEPSKFKNSLGMDLFGYPISEMSKAFFYYDHYLNQGKIAKAEDIFKNIKIGLEIEQLASMAKKYYIKISQKLNLQTTSLEDIIWSLYSLYLNKPIEQIQNLVYKADSSEQARWQAAVPDENNVTPKQLDNFYNSSEFPAGIVNVTGELALAYRVLPFVVKKKYNFKRIFDFGGNIGVALSVMANNDPTATYNLIELSTNALNFAKWRNDIIGIQNIEYINSNDISSNYEAYKGKFDFGITTEVLEHLYDVESSVQMLADLLEPGGILFMTASFGYYPHPGHLKKNVKYFKNENELMSRYGFEPIRADFPIPLLDTFHMYRKR